MEVITIESSAFKELELKINLIAKFLIARQPTNKIYDVCSTQKIKESTLQRLRSKGL